MLPDADVALGQAEGLGVAAHEAVDLLVGRELGDEGHLHPEQVTRRGDRAVDELAAADGEHLAEAVECVGRHEGILLVASRGHALIVSERDRG